MLKKMSWLTGAVVMLPLAFTAAAYAHEEGVWNKDNSATPGDCAQHWHGHPMAPGDHANLPPAAQKALHDAMQQAMEKNKPLHEKMHALHKELTDILSAPKFDKAAFLEKKHELIKLEGQAHANMAKAFAGAVGPLSHEDRTALAEAMKHWHHHWQHGPHGGPHPGDEAAGGLGDDMGGDEPHGPPPPPPGDNE